MTAPRRAARPAPPGRAPRRPGSLTLALIALSLAIALPIGALAAAIRFDTGEAVLAATTGMVLVAVLAFLAATKRRAGGPIGRGGLMLPALVSTALIVAAYVGIAYAWDNSRPLENDFVGLDALLPLGLMASVTFIIVYSTLSMARS